MITALFDRLGRRHRKAERPRQRIFDRIDLVDSFGDRREDLNLCGPVMRACYVDKDDKDRVVFEYWMELPKQHVTSQADSVSIELAKGQKILHFEVLEIDKVFPEYVWVTVAYPLSAFLNSSYRPRLPGAKLNNTIYSVSFDSLLFEPDIKPKRPPFSIPSETDSENPGFTEMVRRRIVASRTSVENTPPPDRRFSFAVGSCRYPGTLIDRHRADAIYAAIIQAFNLVEKDAGSFDCLFLLGDQIYADATANVLDPSVPRDRYIGSYSDAWRSPYFKHLLSQLPVHFAMDDHEMSDSWSGNYDKELAIGEAQKKQYVNRNNEAEYAIQAARIFMGRLEVAPTGPNPLHLWYELGCETGRLEVFYPCFVMDTRSERQLRRHEGLHAKELISDEQFCALQRWLSNHSGTSPFAGGPKFIFSGVTLAPAKKSLIDNYTSALTDDGWLGYPATLNKVLDYLWQNNIANVVFVGGDLHLSSVSKIELKQITGNRSLTVWQIVSSGLYAPLPFTGSTKIDYDWNSKYQLPGVNSPAFTANVQSRLLSTSQSHYLRVDVKNNSNGNLQLQIAALGPDNTPVNEMPEGVTDLRCEKNEWVITLA